MNFSHCVISFRFSMKSELQKNSNNLATNDFNSFNAFQPQPIMPTQQQLHEIYEENLRLREEVKGSADAAARNQYLEVKKT